MSKALAEVLLKEKVISAQQFQEANEAQRLSGKSQVRFLMEKRYLSDAKLLTFLSQKYGLPSINLAKFEVKPDVLRLVPLELARKHGVIPLQVNQSSLVVAVADPTVIAGLEDLKFRTKLNLEAVLCTYSSLDAALLKYYNVSTAIETAIESFQADSGDSVFELDRNLAIQVDDNAKPDDAPIITLVNNILLEGIRKGASDIHVECYEKRCRVRMRVDGYLQEVLQIPPQMRRPVLARFKIISKMDLAESRIPQDGRIKIKMSSGEVDFRVSTMPCLFGEKVVLRILSTGSISYDFSKLNFEADAFEKFKRGISAPNGMVLVTGPTGSGKTTTLYSAINELNKIDTNISTAEDPVEYNLEGVNQVQINKDIGLNFPSVLRTFLRQDPDVILVGEIRDYETAEVAIQAALTGHLVLSTLHTNDAPSTILRLMNMGIEPFLVTASLNTVVAQRLLRTVCPKCKEEVKIPIEKLIEVGLPKALAGKVKTLRGKGCVECGKSGYKGRMAVYEVMEVTNQLKELILSGATAPVLKRAALSEGMQTLRTSAMVKVAQGATTLEEALASTTADESSE